ncbi:MAG: peptidoglycan editing factor PgeF [Erythrobacter sp.]|uniref:peptidoglycan editing factor PgeF n=1 Tax=Erythrobacter sp. TaxID=1042 RepID=UPI002634128F|nr:peptidoglycan editing factor PgeF [Erythrobacter sp.]MDJ0979567.1 peptidoglycan editing factor PgeF [Erythrobacter sp.]
MTADLAIERSPALEGIAHGFFGSAGGAHQFGFGGPGAARDVAALRATAAHALSAKARVIAPHQVHSPDVISVSGSWEDAPEGRPVADAVVTATPGLALGIVTADCAPVLFADREAGVIGAAHAGWRGAQGGVLENTVRAMEELGAERRRIAAAIGPTIAQPSYEVDAPFRDHFGADDDQHFAQAPERDGKPRWRFDLPGYVAARIALCEVQKIHDLGRDTFPHPERYHSYRRASSAGEPSYGRQISLIVL